MISLKARFDGRVLVPEQPVDLPQNRVLEVTVTEIPAIDEANGTHSASDEELLAEPPLMALVKALEGLPFDPNSPTDGAAQHDHYLYGTPKRP